MRPNIPLPSRPRLRLPESILRVCAVAVLLVLPVAATAAGAEDLTTGGTSISVSPVTCLKPGANGPIGAYVESDIPGSHVRFYFRRLNDIVEDFYWVQLHPEGAGSYWGVLPQPTDAELAKHELDLEQNDVDGLKPRRVEDTEDPDPFRRALWWRAKEFSDDRNPNGDLEQKKIEQRAGQGRLQQRHWMDQLTNRELQDFLEAQKYEPTEYWAAVHDSFGQVVSVTDIYVTEVRDRCDHELDQTQRGLAENLSVGETAPWQVSEEIFHWKCEGIVTRVDAKGFFRGDEVCRACLIAWWKKKNFLLPVASGLTATGLTLIDGDSPSSASPSRP